MMVSSVIGIQQATPSIENKSRIRCRPTDVATASRKETHSTVPNTRAQPPSGAQQLLSSGRLNATKKTPVFVGSALSKTLMRFPSPIPVGTPSTKPRERGRERRWRPLTPLGYSLGDNKYMERINAILKAGLALHGVRARHRRPVKPLKSIPTATKI
jgi:hypothetical protein